MSRAAELKRLKISLEADKELVGINAVCRTCLLKRFAACKGAAHAVHADGLEGGHSLWAIVDYLGN